VYFAYHMQAQGAGLAKHGTKLLLRKPRAHREEPGI